MAETTPSSRSLTSLPVDILMLLPEHLHNIEDFTNLAATCSRMRTCLSLAASPRMILRLAAAQGSTFFRPDPHFLMLAVARELGHWARRDRANEALFAQACRLGLDGVFILATQHCGLTLARIRELHELRFSIINPVTDIMDKCVGTQWYDTPNFWNGGVSDAYTISSDPSASFFHLAIYGELFAPELESFIDGAGAESPRLSVETRLEFVKYCIPDWATATCAPRSCRLPDGSIDPRRKAEDTGPYAMHMDGGRKDFVVYPQQHSLALIWVLQSSRWRPHLKEARRLAGTEEFTEEFSDEWPYDAEPSLQAWKQSLWETVMACQGLEGMAMLRPDLRESWFPKIRQWRDKIERLDDRGEVVKVGHQETYHWPYLPRDLNLLISGYATS